MVSERTPVTDHSISLFSDAPLLMGSVIFTSVTVKHAGLGGVKLFCLVISKFGMIKGSADSPPIAWEHRSKTLTVKLLRKYLTETLSNGSLECIHQRMKSLRMGK